MLMMRKQKLFLVLLLEMFRRIEPLLGIVPE